MSKPEDLTERHSFDLLRVWSDDYLEQWAEVVATALGGVSLGKQIELPGLLPGTRRIVDAPFLASTQLDKVALDDGWQPGAGEPVILRQSLISGDVGTHVAAIPRGNMRRSAKHALARTDWSVAPILSERDLQGCMGVIQDWRRRLPTLVLPERLVLDLIHAGLLKGLMLRERDVAKGVALFSTHDGIAHIVWWAQSKEAISNRCAPMHRLIPELLSRAAEERCDIVDWGRSPYGSGACDYKRRWGGAPLPLKGGQAVKRAYAIHDVGKTVWSNLPAAITDKIGMWLYPRLVR